MHPICSARIELPKTMVNHSLNIELNPSAQLVTIEFLNGPSIPTLTRDEAEALAAALEDALPRMAGSLQKPNVKILPTCATGGSTEGTI